MKKLRIIVSGGGTGGHIFPAIAIAKKIEKEIPDVEFLFIGAKDRMEMDKVPQAGYKIQGLWISGLQRRISSKNLLFPFKIIYSFFQSIRIINEFNPHLVIGTGGYASALPLLVAGLKKIPSLIQEQNSYAGITNRILAKYAQKICVAYDNMQIFFPERKIELTGNPIRDEILKFTNETEKKDRKTYPKRLTVLVIGGSLGALSINSTIAKDLYKFQKNKINLIWQTGENYYQKALEQVEKNKIQYVKVVDFIKDMSSAYLKADIIVSRAGAIAISELCCVGKPTILVPSPNVSENHQYKNAQSLVNKNAALLVKDKDVISNLVDTIIKLMGDIDLQQKLTKNIKKLSKIDATKRIAKIAIGLINYGSK